MKVVVRYSFFLALAFASCSKDEQPQDPAIEIPAGYADINFAVNAQSQINLRTRMNDLANKAKSVRVAGTSVTRQELLELFSAGDPSVQSEITPYFSNVLAGSPGYFKVIEDASAGGVYTLGQPSGEGGYFEGRVFDENGIEPDEVIDKGMYAAVLYNSATKLMNASMQATDVDKIIALFGANPSFPNSGSTNVAQPDVLMANYAARRDKNNGAGLYTSFKKAAIALRAYINAGSAYNVKRDAELVNLKTAWEKACAATIVNYCHASIAAFTLTAPTNADFATGLHAYSEAVGFVWGWKTIAQQHKIITDAQIDEVLILLNAPSDGIPSSYTFVTDAVNQVPKLLTVISKLQAIYSFSNQDIEDFKTNWVVEQGR
jgi:hypothetical protein